MSEASEPTGMVKSDETLFAIVEAIRDLDGAGVTQLADDLGMTKSAVHKHLKTLEHYEYVRKQDGTYRLGFKFLMLGGYVRGANPLCRLAEPKVAELAKDLGVVSMFSVEEYGRGIIVHQENELSIDIRTDVGTAFFLHQLASGKAMMARLPDEEIRSVVDRFGLPTLTGHTIDSPRTLFEEIEEIRERGFAISMEEGASGEASVGVAIEDPETDTLGAVSISRPVTTGVKEKLAHHDAERLFETVSEIRYQLDS